MKTILSSLFGALVSILVILLYEYLSKIQKWPYLASILSSTCVGVVFLVIYEGINKIKPFRKFFCPMAKIEGEWLIKNKNWPDRPNSVATIRYSSGKYVYQGYGISDDNKLSSEWISRDVGYDAIKRELSFTADALIFQTNQRLRNYGYIKFHNGENAESKYGIGYFIDIADKTEQVYMTLKKISLKEFDEKINEIMENNNLDLPKK